MANPELTNWALEAWIALIDTVAEDDLVGLIDPTFALLVEYWDSFSPARQSEAHDMISRLLKTRASIIREIVHTLPSLAGLPLMSKFEDELDKLKSQMDVRHHFQAFGQRCQNENATVVSRALHELIKYLNENEDWLHEQASAEQPDPVVSQLSRSILDTFILFRDSNPDLSTLCAKCLGLVGCLDYTKTEALKEKKDLVVLSNFDDQDEVREFVIFFLREVLVKAFLSATSSRNQGFLAYAMQALLTTGDFQSSLGARSRDGTHGANYRRWVSLPESMRALLTPFLDSKYFVTAGVAHQPCQYPLYNPDISYRQWIRMFTLDLLKKDVGNENVRSLFSILSRIIRSQEIAIAEFLLPFAILNVVVNGSDAEKADIVRELLTVLERPLSDQSTVRENAILCSQVCIRVLWFPRHLLTFLTCRQYFAY